MVEHCVKRAGRWLPVAEACDDYLDTFCPNWDDGKTTCSIPVSPVPDETGPCSNVTGSIDEFIRSAILPTSPGASTDAAMRDLQKKATGKRDHTIGFSAEMLSLKRIVEMGKKLRKNIFLIHGMKTDMHKTKMMLSLKATSNASPSQFYGEVTDILLVGDTYVCVIDCKSATNQAGGARGQLEKAEFYIASIFSAWNAQKPPIKKIVCFPNVPSSAETREKLCDDDAFSYLFAEHFATADTLAAWWTTNIDARTTDLPFVDRAIFIKACVIGRMTAKIAKGSAELTINEDVVLESTAGASTARVLQQQQHLQANFEIEAKFLASHPNAVPTASSIREFKDTVVIAKQSSRQSQNTPPPTGTSAKRTKSKSRAENSLFLSPEQAVILDSTLALQVYFGTAGTGKTVLLQLKARQLLNDDPDALVLILVPTFLVEVYEEFFSTNALAVTRDEGRLRIVDLETFTTDRDAYLAYGRRYFFIDEYFRCSEPGGTTMDEVDAIVYDEKTAMVCVAIDPLQAMHGFSVSFPLGLCMQALEGGFLHYLTTVQRYPKSIYDRLRSFCGESVQLGHQYVGLDVEVVRYSSNPFVGAEADNAGERGGGACCKAKEEPTNDLLAQLSALVRRLLLQWRENEIAIIAEPRSEVVQELYAKMLEDIEGDDIADVDVAYAFSREWPVVISLQALFQPTAELLASRAYLVESRTTSKLIVFEPMEPAAPLGGLAPSDACILTHDLFMLAYELRKADADGVSATLKRMLQRLLRGVVESPQQLFLDALAMVVDELSTVDTTNTNTTLAQVADAVHALRGATALSIDSATLASLMSAGCTVRDFVDTHFAEGGTATTENIKIDAAPGDGRQVVLGISAAEDGIVNVRFSSSFVGLLQKFCLRSAIMQQVKDTVSEFREYFARCLHERGVEDDFPEIQEVCCFSDEFLEEMVRSANRLRDALRQEAANGVTRVELGFETIALMRAIASHYLRAGLSRWVTQSE